MRDRGHLPANVGRVNPLIDRRWETLVETHPDGAVFHSTAWLKTLSRTYKYEPIVYGIENGGRLIAGIPFCKVKSFITGRRLVSLPFSDHCQPLLERDGQFDELMKSAEDDARQDRLKYVEIRPRVPSATCAESKKTLFENESFVLHKLDISRTEKQLLESFHGDCIRRKIAKAERLNLEYQEGRSEQLLLQFYRLLVLTRRRHGIPPQPLQWFRNLVDCFGDQLNICVASKDDTPIASIITLSFKKTSVYKYGCSDPKYNALAGNIFLLWRAIQQARRKGLTEFDLGRSDYSTPGLIAFKDRWGAAQTPLNYYRSGSAERTSATGESRFAAAGRRLLAAVPDPMFIALGEALYRHVG